MSGQPAVLRIAHLGVTLQGKPILADIDLEVLPGEVVGLAGESGAGKSTLLGCVAGDVVPSVGRIDCAGRGPSSGHWIGDRRRVGRRRRTGGRHGGRSRRSVGVVWQAGEQCSNLDIASNVMLGAETLTMAGSDRRLRGAAERLFADLGIDIRDVHRPMWALATSDQQLVAVARALRADPALLVLDDPTFALGKSETAVVEGILARVKARGAGVLLASRDVHQLLRHCDRVAVLRHGRIVAEVDSATTHPDDLSAMIAGEQVAISARRQLLRLQGLADQLATPDGRASGTTLILTALSAALGSALLCLHVVRDDTFLELAGSVGLTQRQREALQRLPLPNQFGIGPIGGQASTEHRDVAGDLDLGSLRYCAPIEGSTGLLGALSVFTAPRAELRTDELDLVDLYAGYAAGAIERERLVGEIAARNRVLETIRSALEVLSGPGRFDDAVMAALRVLRAGLGAVCVVLREPQGDEPRLSWVSMGDSGRGAPGPAIADQEVLAAIRAVRQWPAEIQPDADCPNEAVSAFDTRMGRGVLLVHWAGDGGAASSQDRALVADAAHFLRLAFERQDAETARQEARALRHAEALQRTFFARLSHELRTPLTAIRGYASSLTQPDVQWDADVQHEFLTRISDESEHLGRLVADLLDFSAIEAGVLRIHPDWCDLPLILDAARECLPAPAADRVLFRVVGEPPAIWADHDRLEQVFTNLIGNAIRHNPSSTTVTATVEQCAAGVAVTIADDGVGLPAPDGAGRARLRSATSGSGLGLSIVRGIVTAHGGTVAQESAEHGTRWRITLPENPPPPADGGSD